jgi:hypothetical protein
LQASVIEEFKRDYKGIGTDSILRIADYSPYYARAVYCIIVEIVFWIATFALSLVSIYYLVNIIYLLVTPRAYILMYILDSLNNTRR